MSKSSEFKGPSHPAMLTNYTDPSFYLTWTDGKVTCLTAYKNYLYIGTSKGAVHLYEVSIEVQDDDRKKVHYSDKECCFQLPSEEQERIIKMEVDPDAGLLFVMDARRTKIIMLDMYTLNPTDFSESRPNGFHGGEIDLKSSGTIATINCWCLDSEPDRHRIAIQYGTRAAQDQNLAIYQYASSDGTHQRKMELEPNDKDNPMVVSVKCKFVFLCGDYICFVLENSSEFIIYNTNSSRSKNQKYTRIYTKQGASNYIWEPVKGKNPQIQFLKKVKQDKYLVLVKYGTRIDVCYLDGIDNPGNYVSVYRDKDVSKASKQTKFSEMNFAFEPEGENNLCFNGGYALSFPYVAALMRKDKMTTIEFRNLFNPKDSLRSKDYAKTASIKDPEPVNLPREIVTLISCIGPGHARFYTATPEKIVAILPPSSQQIHEILTKDGFQIYANYFLEFVGEGATKNISYQITEANSSLDTGIFYNAIAKLTAARKQSDKLIKELDARMLISRFTKAADGEEVTFTNERLIDENLIRGSDDSKEVSDFILSPSTKPKSLQSVLKINLEDVPLARKNIFLYKAENVLLFYLEKCRNPNAKNQKDADEQAAIDNCLLYLYLQRLNSDLTVFEKVVNLVKGDNHLDTSQSNSNAVTLLSKHKKFLALLYVSKNQIHEALKCLKDMLVLNKTKEDKQATEMDILQDMVSILEKCEDWNIVKLYGKIVMDREPTKGSEIFTKQRYNVTFRPKVVIEFLSNYPFDVVQKYLRYLIEVEQNSQQKYHTDYALKLMKSLSTLMPTNIEIGKKVRITAGSEPGLVGEFRRSLIAHLEKRGYDFKVVQDRLNQTNLYVEQAIFYRLSEKYEEGIKVLLEKLEDYDLAVQYCDELFKPTTFSDDPTASFVYNPYLVSFLKICFADKDGKKDPKLVNWGKQLLKYRARDIEPSEAIKLLDDNIPINSVQQFIRECILNTQSKFRTSKMLAKVAECGNLDIHHRHSLVSQRHVEINLQSLCSFCNAPIGDSVITIFPDLSIVHFRCLRTKVDGDKKIRDRNVHPTTGQDFSRYPVNIDFDRHNNFN